MNILRGNMLSRAVRETRPMYEGFTPEQRKAFLAANAITLGRPVVRAAVEVVDTMTRPEGGKTSLKRRLVTAAVHALLDLGDAADGKIVRKFGAVTPFGKVADTLADKVDFAVQEVARATRGEMNPLTPFIRTTRDAASMASREVENVRSQHEYREAQVQAGWPGKLSTGARSVANRIGDVAPNSLVAKVAEHTATVGLLGSLAANVRTYVGPRNAKVDK